MKICVSLLFHKRLLEWSSILRCRFVTLLLLLCYLLSFLAHPRFYLFYEGKHYGEKPPSSAGYNCVRAFTCFCVNSQRMCISEAPAGTGGGDSLPVGSLLLLSPHEALRAFSGSFEFLLLGTACYDVPGVVGSIRTRASRIVGPNRVHMQLYSLGPSSS